MVQHRKDFQREPNVKIFNIKNVNHLANRMRDSKEGREVDIIHTINRELSLKESKRESKQAAQAYKAYTEGT